MSSKIKNKGFFHEHKQRLALINFAFFSLAIALVLNFFFTDKYLSDKRFAENVVKKVDHEISIIDREVDRIRNIVEKNQNISFSDFDVEFTYPLFLYRNDRLIYWSTYSFTPNLKELTGNYTYKFVDIPQGKYLVKMVTFEADLTGYVFLPLYYDYQIDNRYVEPGFNEKLFNNSSVTIYEAPTEDGFDIHEGKNYLFTVEFNENYSINVNPFTLLIFLLTLVSIVLFFVFVFSFIRYFHQRNAYDIALLLLFSSLVLVRSTMLITNYPMGLIEMKIFDSMYYASSGINPSLGDLLLNLMAFLLIVIYLFRYFFRLKLYQKVVNSGENVRAIISILLIFAHIGLLYFVYYIFLGLNFHSQWTLDINTSINFSYLKIMGLFIILILATIFFLLSHVIFKIFTKINRKSNFLIAFDLIIGALLFITVAMILQINFWVITIISLIYFLTIYLLDLPKYLINIQYRSLFYFFSVVVAISIVGSYATYRYEKDKDAHNRERLTDQLLMEHDYHGEFLLFEAIEKIKNDVLIKSRMLNPLFLPTNIVEQKIRRVYLGYYFDKYEKNILLFGANGELLNRPDSELNYYNLKARYSQYQTDYESIYFLNQQGMNVPKRYLAFIEIERSGFNIGYILIELKQKRIVPNSVYPELLVDQSYIQPYLSSNEFDSYSYAVMLEDEILFSSGSFNYVTEFDRDFLLEDDIYGSGVRDDGKIHYAKRSMDNRIIIVTSKSYPLKFFLSNFSFLFLFIIFFILILSGIYSLYFAFTNVNLNYAAKIQLYSNFAFFLPLLVVSITILSILISSNRREVEQEYLQKAENISYELVEPLYNFNRHVYGIGNEELTSQLLQISNYANLDLNLFNVNGKLIASSQPIIYENNLLSEFINPGAISDIIEKRNNSVILDESVGSLTYKTTYVAVQYFFTGEIIGILSIPFFESKYELDNQIIEVFTSVINIFTFIFIVFLIFSYFASKWLTFPLRLITHKIRKTSLAEYNAPLTWNSDDEIGLMVREYNKMLENLEESKKALARSQKESAWREIAQQVAHEIKNPLTPMKLTLQHLKRMMESDKPGKDSIAERPINTLLHQINTLSDIAESFSAFAKMPIPESEKFEISSVLKKIINLHKSSQDGQIDANIEKGQFYVIGDEQWMGRIFNNLIINGFQAVPEERKPQIRVQLSTDPDKRKVCISILDNGSGISEDIREKIFIPNFSTKMQGSGIGLAVAKRGVEHAGGKIWFDSQEGEGTTFFIELPLENWESGA